MSRVVPKSARRFPPVSGLDVVQQVMVEFVDWLRQWNLARAEEDRAGLFGLDLYSMHASIESVLGYLDKTDPDAARHARQRYSCFEFFGEDPQAHGYATARGHAEPCEDEEIAQLVELRRKYGEPMRRNGQLAKDEYFYAEQNARLIAFGQSWTHSASLGQSNPQSRAAKHRTIVALGILSYEELFHVRNFRDFG